MARASILWLIGEYCEHVPKIAPDVLRKMAKSFTNEEDIVKLQIINLAAKLYLTNSKQVWMTCLSIGGTENCCLTDFAQQCKKNKKSRVNTFYILYFHRPNFWHSMFSTWPSMTRITTSGTGHVSFASSSCPLRRVELWANMLRNCSSPSNLHPSSSLLLKVQKPLQVLSF